MRVIVVVGMVLAAGSAWGQGLSKDSVVSSVANATAGASWCGFKVDSQAADKALSGVGFKREDPTESSKLDRQFEKESAFWQMFGANAPLNADSRKMLDSKCDQLWSAFGPEGVIRKGLLSQK